MGGTTSSSITPGASTSSSSIKNSFKYDVFLSFRGEDTRKTFVDHLYHALKDKGIYTYKDDEKIQKGKRIRDDLFQSIEDSKFYIIVFSKNYASSSWCLEELVKIMKCHKMPGHTAYPVFYDVEPTQVRNQSGAVGDAFSKHENQEAILANDMGTEATRCLKLTGSRRNLITVMKGLVKMKKLRYLEVMENGAETWRMRRQMDWKLRWKRIGEALEAADLAGCELKNTALDGLIRMRGEPGNLLDMVQLWEEGGKKVE